MPVEKQTTALFVDIILRAQGIVDDHLSLTYENIVCLHN